MPSVASFGPPPAELFRATGKSNKAFVFGFTRTAQKKEPRVNAGLSLKGLACIEAFPQRHPGPAPPVYPDSPTPLPVTGNPQFCFKKYHGDRHARARPLRGGEVPFILD
jgi:hypothetical protein